MYVSTKSYGPEAGYSICYRQHKADSHCRFLHGYALGFDFEFEAEELDVRNWVCDFGGFSTLKDFLNEHFDHTLLVAQDDPRLEEIKALQIYGLAKVREVEKTGCEGLASFLYWWIQEVWLPTNGYGDRVHCRKVHVHETPGNSAWVEFSREEWANQNAD